MCLDGTSSATARAVARERPSSAPPSPPLASRGLGLPELGRAAASASTQALASASEFATGLTRVSSPLSMTPWESPSSMSEAGNDGHERVAWRGSAVGSTSQNQSAAMVRADERREFMRKLIDDEAPLSSGKSNGRRRVFPGRCGDDDDDSASTPRRREIPGRCANGDDSDGDDAAAHRMQSPDRPTTLAEDHDDSGDARRRQPSYTHYRAVADSSGAASELSGGHPGLPRALSQRLLPSLDGRRSDSEGAASRGRGQSLLAAGKRAPSGEASKQQQQQPRRMRRLSSVRPSRDASGGFPSNKAGSWRRQNNPDVRMFVDRRGEPAPVYTAMGEKAERAHPYASPVLQFGGAAGGAGYIAALAEANKERRSRYTQ